MVSAIVDKAGEETGTHSFTLFYVLLHVMALQPQGSLQREVKIVTIFAALLLQLVEPPVKNSLSIRERRSV